MKISTKPVFGTSKFGGSTGSLVAMSLGGGVLLAAAFVMVMLWLQNPEQPGIYAAIYFILTLPVMTSAAWVFLVDRETIRGAVRNPENSVEGAWYSHAAADTFHALMAGGGIGCLVFTVWPLQASISTILLGALVLMQVIFWTSYAIRKRLSV